MDNETIRAEIRKLVHVKTRSELRKVIAANVEEMSKNIYEICDRNIQDLVAGGIDHARVANASLYAALFHQQQILGTRRLIGVLRALADSYERKIGGQDDGAAAVH